MFNASTRDLREISVSFPGYSVRTPLAAGGRAGELQVAFDLPRTADVTWTDSDGTTHRERVRFPEEWPAKPKSGDGLLFTFHEKGVAVALQIRRDDSYYPQELQIYPTSSQ